VRRHYEKIYLESPNFPLPKRASPSDTALLQDVPREQFQQAKKRRIETRKEAAKNAPPATPKQKPTASVPSCHEVQGYMPGRLEFETEYANEAEEAVQHMQFDPGDGVNPRTGELEPEMELKLTVMDIYNARLTQRADRKKIMFEHNLLDYRKASALDKKRTKEERDLLNRAKPFARMMNQHDFEEFNKGLINELNLRQAIAQLQDWREKKITNLLDGEKYEQDKVIRAQKSIPMGSMDRERFASSQRTKAVPAIEVPSGAAALVAPELPTHLTQETLTISPGRSALPDKILTNGHANGNITPVKRDKVPILPLSTVTPMHLSQENAADLHLLTEEEIELCEKTRINPKPYLVLKEAIIKEAMKGNGQLKRKQVKELSKIEGSKAGRIFDFFVNSGWISKA
jgi:transcriptional adapter 2-alpha